MRADPTGADACVRDFESADATKKKQFPVNEFVDYFAGLGRPLGAHLLTAGPVEWGGGRGG